MQKGEKKANCLPTKAFNAAGLVCRFSNTWAIKVLFQELWGRYAMAILSSYHKGLAPFLRKSHIMRSHGEKANYMPTKTLHTTGLVCRLSNGWVISYYFSDKQISHDHPLLPNLLIRFYYRADQLPCRSLNTGS